MPQIWTTEGSPLRVHTEKQAKLLQGYLGENIASAASWSNTPCATATRRCPTRWHRLKAAGLRPHPDPAALPAICRQSSTATAFDAAYACAAENAQPAGAAHASSTITITPATSRRWPPSIRDYWQMHGRPDELVMSFHGVPRYTLDKGDPYHCECQKTGRLLAEALDLTPNQFRVTFQSRFGRAEWLQALHRQDAGRTRQQGVKRRRRDLPRLRRRLPGNPGRNRDGRPRQFPHAGGKEFHYIPASTNTRTGSTRSARSPWKTSVAGSAIAGIATPRRPTWLPASNVPCKLAQPAEGPSRASAKNIPSAPRKPRLYKRFAC